VRSARRSLTLCPRRLSPSCSPTLKARQACSGAWGKANKELLRDLTRLASVGYDDESEPLLVGRPAQNAGGDASHAAIAGPRKKGSPAVLSAREGTSSDRRGNRVGRCSLVPARAASAKPSTDPKSSPSTFQEVVDTLAPPGWGHGCARRGALTTSFSADFGAAFRRLRGAPLTPCRPLRSRSSRRRRRLSPLPGLGAAAGPPGWASLTGPAAAAWSSQRPTPKRRSQYDRSLGSLR